jgi:LCP family protein required for cell wall assembly
MLRLHGGAAIAGKAGYALSCIIASVVLVASGVGYYAQSKAESPGNSSVLAGGPSTGPMNILVMGLESRTYWSGKPLPRSLTNIMHIGNVGGNATNTLILIHIFDGGTKAVGFSIPRDDYVRMYGTLGFGPRMSKIDNAYGYAMAARQSWLRQKAPDMPSWRNNFEGNEAGRAATVATVEALTGVKIDHFAELNLDGFYMVAQAFGGVEACVKGWPGGGGIPKNGNLTDTNSGANLKIGYQHLTAAQALSFVRERDNLPGGDLDRTARQQAVLDYVLWKLKTDGLLTDVGRLNSLMGFASNYLITSAGWNLLQFAGEMDALTGQNMTFHTLPITGQESVGDIGAVNTVDPAQIQDIVKKAFSEPPADTAAGKGAGKGSASGSSGKKPSAKPTVSVPPASTVTVDVYNGGNTRGLAGLVSQALAAKGYQAGVVQTATHQSLTTVTYGPGAAANAGVIAKYFGLTPTAGNSMAAGHVQVILGADATTVPAPLRGTASSAATGSPSTQATPSPTATSTTPSFTTQNGASVTVKAKAKYGIPCVY